MGGAPPAVEGRRVLLVAGAHLAALSAFAFAQPLFDLLSDSPAFFAAHGSTGADVIVFALALTLVPAGVLLALEALAGLVDDRLRVGLHLFFVAGLSALVFLHVAVRTGIDLGLGLLAAAALAGAGVAFVYRRAALLRSFFTVLAPAPLVFLALFLFASPAQRFAFPEERTAQAAAVTATTPVVVIVFDELATASLMTREGELDAVRFPGFAELARESTWYRNATTVNAHTHLAVPALLSGRVPAQGSLPVFGDHPNNLFSLLADDYELRAVEPLTRLCPPGVCRGASAESFTGRMRSLWTDLGVVYAHLVLPESLSSDLPPITDNWSDFLRTEEDEAARPRNARDSGGIQALRRDLAVCGRNVCDFAGLVTRPRGPTLYFLHSLLPHAPWLYLPSGRRYAGDVRDIPGSENGVWLEEWPAQQGNQRHLLQLGYTDRALAALLDRLRAEEIYDEAVIVVVADHGVSFQTGQPRRNATEENLVDLAFVPLFVKEPRQTSGRVDDSFARTVDLVPTIADLLGAELPWPVDGRSLVGEEGARDGRVAIPNQAGELLTADLSTLLEERELALSAQVGLFGEGDWESVYAAWSDPSLLRAQVAELDILAGEGSAKLDGERFLRQVRQGAGIVRTYLTGSIEGDVRAGTPLAVAVNGTVVAQGRAYQDGDEIAFGLLVPEEALRGGLNRVELFVVGSSVGRPSLVRLQSGSR
jgi:hypothetical protein